MKNEEVVVTWEDIYVNDVLLSRESKTTGKQSDEKEVFWLPPDAKGYMTALPPEDSEKGGVSDDIAKLSCSVYQKEHPSREASSLPSVSRSPAISKLQKNVFKKKHISEKHITGKNIPEKRISAPADGHASSAGAG